ncbi:hypothetical protein NDU88_005372 [Pleurodeles waltl]|uniref:Uncharacterized protein n=1 Tax=Pleurodeles waltl TaxID=8319 RepID=A0AAV7TB53_PLEWA|nr:hypothetical protein NDU88_005372 [Pleurodeles waltl]
MENGVTSTPQDQILTPQAKENMDKLDTTLKEIRDSRQAIENRLEPLLRWIAWRHRTQKGAWLCFPTSLRR